MDTSRAVINITDNSDTLVQETTEITGFTVVKAPKGPITPVRINKGGAAELKDIFGVSSKEYPELFEAETFNREYDLYVSAPYSSAKVPVAYLTGNGIVVGSDLIDYDTTVESYALGEIDDLPGVNFVPQGAQKLMDVKHPEKYGFKGSVDKDHLVPETVSEKENIAGEEISVEKGLLIYTGIKIGNAFKGEDSESNDKLDIPSGLRIVLKNGESLDYTIALEDSGIYYISKNGSHAGTLSVKEIDGKYYALTEDRVTADSPYVIYITLSDVRTDIPHFTDPEVRQSLGIYWVSDISSDDVYAVIFPKYPSERDLHISFTDFSDIRGYSSKSFNSWNVLKMKVYEDGAFRDSSNPVYVEGSLNPKDRGSDGSFIGFSGLNASYRNQNLVCVYPIQSFNEDSSFNDSISGFGSIVLSGGVRSLETSGDIHEAGWVKAGEGEYSDVDVFFDSEIHETDTAEPNNKFLSLATDDVTSHELAGYIFNKTLTPTELDSEDYTKLGYGKNYWNVCNIGIIEDRTNGTRFASALTGAKALMQARIIEAKMGGVAPMWENSSVGGISVGGQLNMINVYKLKYKYNKKQLDLLDDLNYNPVINDRQYGIMVVGQKTCKDGKTTDWSYIGHACAFFNFLKQVRANVMLPQIGKPNNPYYRTLRKDQVDLYLGQRINGSDRIWAEAECDTSTADGVNDVHALKARKFVIKVRVKVDVFSEKVELNFTNEGQDTIISMAQ